MKTIKTVLVICGIIVTIGLIYYNLMLKRQIKVQTEMIITLEQMKDDSLVLNEYKKNFTILKSKSTCNSTLDSLFNNSEYLKTK